jgi:serine/threonine-protein kinase
MLSTSTRLGHYEILAPLGAGGMGEVYRARDTRLGREVAVKVLPEALASNTERQARFEREAKAVAALSHPNILAIHDYGTQGPIIYAVMELLEGETLRSRLTKGPLSWREAVEIGTAIAEGLAAAHAKGIIHRDLKPENLFLTSDGRVKILDFGLARVTALPDGQEETGSYVSAETDPGKVMGTIGYMSPEQVRGQPAEAPSDIFAFGCVMYEILTGRRAFQKETAAETMTAILHDEPPDHAISLSNIPPELGRLIRQCLAKSASQRLQSARDLALALRATASDPSIHHLPRPRYSLLHYVVVFAAVLLIGGIGATIYFLTRGGNRSESARFVQESKAIEAIAVLPFEDRDKDPRIDHLSEGIPETIIQGLYCLRLPDLKVQSLMSVAHYKGRQPSLDEIRRELGVGVVVTGRLEKRPGDILHVSVSLIKVSDGSMLWGHEYDKNLLDILALQDEITKGIAANVRPRLTGEEERRLTKHGTNNPEAHELYLKGRYFWNKRTPEGLQKAIDYFNQAIRMDPNYALAYAGLAAVYSVFPFNADTRPSDYFPQALAAAKKALELDSQIGEAHAALAWIAAIYEWNWAASEQAFKYVIESDPNCAISRQWYGGVLLMRGKFNEAREQHRRAVELDPLSLVNQAIMGRDYFWTKEYDRAIQYYRKTLEMDPEFGVAHIFLGQAYIEKHLYHEALAELQKGEQVGSLEPLSLRGRAYALMGRRADALNVIAQLKSMPNRYVPPCRLAVVYGSLGEKEQALDWLEKAYKERDKLLWYLEVEPAYKDLRSDSRFASLLQRVGLTDKIATPPPVDHTVAVLPFKNDTGDPKSEYLSDGIPDEIIHSLSRVRRKDLIVRPFSSVARYRGKAIETATVGQELRVQTIVTGTLRQTADKFSVSVAVEDVEQQKEIWGKTYPPESRDAILDLQDRIARDVAAEVRLQLTDKEEHRLTQRDTEDPEAYLLYREGVYHMNKFTETELKTAIDYYQRAFRKDSKYALACAGLGRCYILLGALHQGPRKTFSQAREYLLQAQAMDPTNSGPATGLGTIHMFLDWDWPAADQLLKNPGGDIDPAHPTRNMYGFYLAAQGRAEDALDAIRELGEIELLPAPRRNELAMAYNWTRRFDQAIASAQKALELDPHFPFAYAELGTAYVLKGEIEKAIHELRQALDQGAKHPRIIGMLGYAYAKAGRNEEARKILEELTTIAKSRFGCALSVARIYAALGENDEAFHWLHKSCDERDSYVIWIKVDPTLDNLRKDSRFAKVLKEMKLPP